MRFALLLSLCWSCYAGEWIIADCSAYCPCALCCDTRTERTANGTDTNKVPYGVAASPNIPLGAKVYVPHGGGYLDAVRSGARWFSIDDRGSALRSDWRRTGITRIDLRFRTHHSAMEFGRRLMTIYVEKPQ